MPSAFDFSVSPFNCLTTDQQRLVRTSVDIDCVPEGQAMHRLMRFIGSRPLVGYFLDFDLGLIKRAIFPLLGVPLPQPRFEVSSMFYEWKFRQRPPYQQQGSVHIDLRFATLMRELDLPERQAHDVINDAVMAGLAFLEFERLLGR